MVKRILMVLLAGLLLIVIFLFSFPVVFKKQISYRVKTELNDRVNARVEYQDLSISLLHSFPNLTVSLKDFIVIGQQEFEGDTLAAAKDFSFTVDLIGIITGRGYKVISLNLLRPSLKLSVNGNGRANWDILKPVPAISPGAEGGGPAVSDSTFLFQVNNWKIEDAYLEFRNDSARTLFVAADLNFNGGQSINKDGADYNTSTLIKALSYRAGGISYLQNVKLDAAVQFSSENNTHDYRIKENRIAFNELQLLLRGSFKNTTEGQDFNLAIQSADSAFKDLLSVIPGLNDSSYAQLKSSGSFSFQGTIKGVSNSKQGPAVSFKLKVRDGELQKPDFAQALKHIYVDASLVKPSGPMDSAVVEVSRFSVQTGNDSANARILVTTPSSNANITAEVKGDINLATVFQFYNSSDVKQLSGALHADLKFNGRKNDLDHKNYKNIQASGQLLAKNISFQKNDWPAALEINEAAFSVVPAFISLYQLTGQFGKCNFKGTGKFENVIPYLARQSNLKAELAINADSINLKEWAGKPQGAKAADPKPDTHTGIAGNENMKSGAAPDVEFVIHVAANKVYDDKLVFSNVHGTVESIAKAIHIKDVNANILGGNVVVNGTCYNYNLPQANVDFDMKANNLDIAQVYKAIDDPEKTVPALKYLSGGFSGDISGNGKLKADHSLNFNALIANGNLHYPDLKINEMPVLMEIGKLAKVKSLDHLEAKNVQSAFHFKNGNVTIDPTDIKFTNGYKLNFKGTNYVNQIIDADIALDVPVKEFGSIASMAQNLLSGFMNVPDNVHFVFKVTGNSAQPKVKVVNVGASGN